MPHSSCSNKAQKLLFKINHHFFLEYGILPFLLLNLSEVSMKVITPWYILMFDFNWNLSFCVSLLQDKKHRKESHRERSKDKQKRRRKDSDSSYSSASEGWQSGICPANYYVVCAIHSALEECVLETFQNTPLIIHRDVEKPSFINLILRMSYSFSFFMHILHRISVDINWIQMINYEKPWLTLTSVACNLYMHSDCINCWSKWKLLFYYFPRTSVVKLTVHCIKILSYWPSENTA